MTLRNIILTVFLITATIGVGCVLSEAQYGPSESECRPYIEKALQGAGTPENPEAPDEASPGGPEETLQVPDEPQEGLEGVSVEVGPGDENEGESGEADQASQSSQEEESSGGDSLEEPAGTESVEEHHPESVEEHHPESVEEHHPESVEEHHPESVEEHQLEIAEETIAETTEETSAEKDETSEANTQEVSDANSGESEETQDTNESETKNESSEVNQSQAGSESTEDEQAEEPIANESLENNSESVETEMETESESKENTNIRVESIETENLVEQLEEIPKEDEVSQPEQSNEQTSSVEISETVKENSEETSNETQSIEDSAQLESNTTNEDTQEIASEPAAPAENLPEEDLIMEIEVPSNLRSRAHMAEILQLDSSSAEHENILAKVAESTLKDLKKLYDVAIKPLEILYKYRDLSNRHFGDPEIFSKPLILFMGPWSGGKSTIINYLLENEYKRSALRTGAEPSPAYFNIVMWGEKEEVLDGTQLAADWTFSGLQKFGQGLLDRLKGLKLNHPLLEKVNIVEIPGILEIRKQVERLFPFNDACQWFIDRADIIFLVYDPSKLDVGPESEAILDQLKGREMQTRIILNKADQVRPEELMRVQGTLIWNISPLMSSTEPPVMYSTSLWSLPYESGAPTRLLYAQERALLRDLREAIDRRVENKISSARRFAVRVRNHAKMVDCYLTTYYNHKTFFGNKKKVSDDIIEHPQNYHIYEGLSTLTNISRYDLPDPDVYKDFFRLNPVYEFQQLSATCTYFRGCPINRLDVAIAYDLPELVGKYKKSIESLFGKK